MTTLMALLLIREIAGEGRVLSFATPPAQRLAIVDPIAPGSAPILAFRLVDGRQRGRFTGVDLVLDDAGH